MVKEELANRPDNTAFTQQRLPAWQPMLSAGIVIPGFLVIGLAFIGIGVALFVTSQSIQVLEVWEVKPPIFASCWILPRLVTLNLQPFIERGVASVTKAEVLFPSIMEALVLSSPVGLHGGRAALPLLQVLWSNCQELCLQSGIHHYYPVQGWIQMQVGHFMMLGSADATFSSTGACVLLLWFVQLLPELQEIWRVQRWRAAVWRLG